MNDPLQFSTSLYKDGGDFFLIYLKCSPYTHNKFILFSTFYFLFSLKTGVNKVLRFIILYFIVSRIYIVHFGCKVEMLKQMMLVIP